MDSIKLRAKTKGDHTEIKAIITHPMETGRRKDKATGEKVPAHFIQEVIIESEGKTILTADWSGSISKNPYIGFRYKGTKGATIKVTWTDNKGETDTAETTIK